MSHTLEPMSQVGEARLRTYESMSRSVEPRSHALKSTSWLGKAPLRRFEARLGRLLISVCGSVSAYV